MREALLRDARDLELDESPKPEIGPDEVLVKVRACAASHRYEETLEEIIEDIQACRAKGIVQSGHKHTIDQIAKM